MIRGSRFMLVENATAQSIGAYVQVTGAGPTVHAKAAIYDLEENKIEETNQLTLAPGAASWQTFPFGTPPGLTGNREYWLLVLSEDIAGSDCLVFYDDLDSIGIDQGLYLSHTYNTFPANLSGRTKQQTKFSIYCNYT